MFISQRVYHLYTSFSHPKLEDELEVTGISRSGRVRKKSSKLLDYESGAEDERSKKNEPSPKMIQQGMPGPSQYRQSNGAKGLHFDYTDQLLQGDLSLGAETIFSESELELGMFQQSGNVEEDSFDTSGSEMEVDLLDVKIPEEIHPPEITSKITGGYSQTSLYMQENAKPGRKPKAGRKDKGKARFSAYMLWAKQIRPLLMKTNVNMDFSQLSSRLSELWATVPYTEKCTWRKKAKRLAMSAKIADGNEERIASKTQFKAVTTPRKYVSKKAGQAKDAAKSRTTLLSQSLSSLTSSVGLEPIGEDLGSNIMDPLYHVLDTKPLDVAGYLKLLGEALLVIGKRLKEHQGPIAVSGSLSVLLDALLCALGALLCLTQQVMELNCIPKHVLETIMDNITIIMPGLSGS